MKFVTLSPEEFENLHPVISLITHNLEFTLKTEMN